MTATDALRAALAGDGHERALTLDRAFQGLPDTAHGGSVLAAFDVVAGGRGPRTLRGDYLKRVPLGVALRLRVTDGGRRSSLLDEAGVLVEGTVTSGDDGGGAVVGDVAPFVDGRVTPAPSADAMPLPVTRGCFACGIDNALGLRVQLRADESAVGGTWTPRPGFRRDDGTLAPLALTTLLDEAAFWLGALATGESGMTTELRVTLHAEPKADAAITISGQRADVRPRAGDARYWDTAVGARDEDGRLVASATITFVAVRGAARRLATAMLAVNSADVLRRVFPAYVQ